MSTTLQKNQPSKTMYATSTMTSFSDGKIKSLTERIDEGWRPFDVLDTELEKEANERREYLLQEEWNKCEHYHQHCQDENRHSYLGPPSYDYDKVLMKRRRKRGENEGCNGECDSVVSSTKSMTILDLTNDDNDDDNGNDNYDDNVDSSISMFGSETWTHRPNDYVTNGRNNESRTYNDASLLNTSKIRDVDCNPKRIRVINLTASKTTDGDEQVIEEDENPYGLFPCEDSVPDLDNGYMLSSEDEDNIELSSSSLSPSHLCRFSSNQYQNCNTAATMQRCDNNEDVNSTAELSYCVSSSSHSRSPLDRLNSILLFHGTDQALLKKFRLRHDDLLKFKHIRSLMKKIGLEYIDLDGNPFKCCLCLDIVFNATSFSCKGKHTCCKNCHDNHFKLCFKESQVSLHLNLIKRISTKSRYFEYDKGATTRQGQLRKNAEGPIAKCPMCMQEVKMYDSKSAPLVDNIITNIADIDSSAFIEEGYSIVEEL